MAHEAIAAVPASAALHHRLGLLLFAAGGVEDALLVQRIAVALDPAHAEFQAHLGKILHRAGDVTGAEAALRQALVLDPGAIDASIDLVYLLADQARLDELEAEAVYAAAATRAALAARGDHAR